MQTQTRSRTAFADQLQASVGELVERAASAAPGPERSRLLRWLLVGGAVFLLWRVERSARKLLWTMFGIGMALYWSGAAGWLLR
ncbi:hypothetical protein [Thermomonas fusca]|uniref:hypothetical protein n=1 Tax=Thermomonas fusca TaxID=215690 RepID=UPI0003FF19B4|nr:hypothetical protein [Thermomonas fusca]